MIGSQPLVELTATGLPNTCPVAVIRRWATVLADAPRATGHIELERLLTAPDDVTEPIHQLLACSPAGDRQVRQHGLDSGAVAGEALGALSRRTVSIPGHVRAAGL